MELCTIALLRMHWCHVSGPLLYITVQPAPAKRCVYSYLWSSGKTAGDEAPILLCSCSDKGFAYAGHQDMVCGLGSQSDVQNIWMLLPAWRSQCFGSVRPSELRLDL